MTVSERIRQELKFAEDVIGEGANTTLTFPDESISSDPAINGDPETIAKTYRNQGYTVNVSKADGKTRFHFFLG